MPFIRSITFLSYHNADSMLGLVSGLRVWEKIPSGLLLPSRCVEHSGKTKMSKASLLISAFKRTIAVV